MQPALHAPPAGGREVIVTAVSERHGGLNAGSFDERHGPGNRGFDWESTGRADDTGREIKFVRSDGKSKIGPAFLIVAGVLLAVLAVGMGVVSFHAQFAYVLAEKGDRTAAFLEALGLDIGAVIFALLGLALAMLGRPAVVPRMLNLACVAGSLTMNVFSAHLDSWTSIFVWAMPALLYALASDQLIAVLRRQMIGKDEGSPLKAARGLLLWTLRLIFGPVTTVKGFRAWVLTLPSSPGPGEIHDHPEPAGVGGDHYSRGISGAITGHDQADQPPITVERVSAITDHRERRAVTAPITDHRSPISPRSADHRAVTDQPPITDHAHVSALRREHRAVTVPITDHVSAAQPITDHASVTPINQLDEVIGLVSADHAITGRVIGERLGVSEATGRRLKGRALKAIGERS
jgi:hypothetical protein